MSAVPEEALKEIAATNEPPNRLASPEFFFLLQRIDRLDEKLSARIDRVDEKLSSRINRLEEKIDRVQDRLDAVKLWAIGAVITLIAGFTGVIIALLQR
ncbi:hypothetical protein V3F56_02985 [Moorellaceae bacterium AZ2]